MNVYLAGTAVSLTVLLNDSGGNPLDVTALDCRIVDQDGAEVLARTPLESFVANDTEVLISVPAELNDLPAGSTRAARSVELYCTTTSGVVVLQTAYMIEAVVTLTVGVNTFLTLAGAELTAMNLPNLTGWSNASDREKTSALVDARLHICQLRFTLLNAWSQDSLNYVPEGSTPTPYVGQTRFAGDLSLLTATQYASLPTRFTDALKLAQVAEADAILGGYPVDVRRQEGLMLESIGEVKQMFRPGKPLDLPVCRRALRYLSSFVTFAKVVGRG